MPATPDFTIAGFSHLSRGEELAKDFLSCLGKIDNDREVLIPSGFIADYIALGWIEMKEGHLRATLAGRSMADKLVREGRRPHH
jgi:hypothetical protein